MPVRSSRLRRLFLRGLLVGGAVFAVGAVGFLAWVGHELNEWGKSADPVVMRTIKRDPMASYVPQHVVRQVTAIEYACGEHSVAEVTRAYLLPAAEGRSAFAAAVRAGRAAGWNVPRKSRATLFPPEVDHREAGKTTIPGRRFRLVLVLRNPDPDVKPVPDGMELFISLRSE